ncbi:hypothetical protein P691DRAFT_769410 [Macrolepiota fuliginosa MF-IS2]|uniref:Uncharacterized protein n=1 Tax=Macrolepiota fuliginosa MF-IS2 TaxID=1400762 RepID=A0A9P5WXG9_9AGAR|nr:hypothetical protein P691DRAFT_769410 [Macrolepiota fuliginosa MF-IS2]
MAPGPPPLLTNSSSNLPQLPANHLQPSQSNLSTNTPPPSNPQPLPHNCNHLPTHISHQTSIQPAGKICPYYYTPPAQPAPAPAPQYMSGPHDRAAP